MYARYKTWQNAIIDSQSETVWENEIVLDIDSIDIRFKLKGYGWKPNVSDENLVVLYEGRYSCYYREVGESTWILFSKVVSERATHSDSTVYADTFVELGVVDEKKYELKVVASDAEKFTAWGGSLEGISSGDQFWYDLKIRGSKPLSFYVSEDISVDEFAFGGKGILEIVENETITITENTTLTVA